MSFTIANWTCISGSLSQGQEYVNGVLLNSPNLFTYGSPNDSVATISSANYFLPNYTNINPGDMILGSGTDSTFGLVVLTSSVTGVTTASLFSDSSVVSVTAGTGLTKPSGISPAIVLALNVGNIQNQSYTYHADTGTANTYVVTLTPAVTSLVAGLRLSTLIGHTNTGASTLNVNGLGATVITTTAIAALSAGQIAAGMIADLEYDGTQFQLLNPVSSGGGGVWTASGTDSAVGGDGTSVASGSYSLSYGNSTNTTTGNNCYAFGTANNLTGHHTAAFGNTNVGSAANAFIFGRSNTCNGDYGFAGGYGAVVTNQGSVVWGDSNTTPNPDTLSNQFNLTFANGYRLFVGSVLTFGITPLHSIVGGDGSSVASGNYSFSYGTTTNSCTGDNAFVFGNNNTSTGAEDVIFGSSNTTASGFNFVAGSGNSALGGSTYVFGSGISVNGLTSGFFTGDNHTGNSSSGGSDCFIGGHANGFSGSNDVSNSFLFGTAINCTNKGCIVFSDRNFITFNTAADSQFSANMQNGYMLYVNDGSTPSLALNIDTHGNLINAKGTADQSYSLQAPSTGFSITIGAGVKTLILNPAGTLTSGTVVMPAAPVDGQEIRICTDHIITTLTVNANSGQSLANAFATTLAAGTGIGYIYNLSGTTWYRLY